MADDLIGALTSRVRELSLRVATLESELEAAQRRVRVYEEFDHTIQEALASALRSAFEIREGAEHTASAIIEGAKAQRAAIVSEIEQLRAERERVQGEVAAARVARDAVHQAPTPAAPAAQVPMSEMRLAASEALRGVFKELVAELRSAPPIAATPAPPVAPSAAVETPQPRIEPVPSQVEHRPTSVTPPQVTPPQVTPQAAFVPPTPPAPPFESPSPRFAPVPRFEPAARQQAPAPPAPPRAVIEDVDEAPVRSLSSEPSSEVQLVLSPIPSFPRLVEIERRIQSLAVVRTLYVRDFRGGVATLAVGLRQPLVSEEFAAALSGLEHPRLRVVSSTRDVLELRIDGESAIA